MKALPEDLESVSLLAEDDADEEGTARRLRIGVTARRRRGLTNEKILTMESVSLPRR